MTIFHHYVLDNDWSTYQPQFLHIWRADQMPTHQVVLDICLPQHIVTMSSSPVSSPEDEEDNKQTGVLAVANVGCEAQFSAFAQCITLDPDDPDTESS